MTGHAGLGYPRDSAPVDRNLPVHPVGSYVTDGTGSGCLRVAGYGPTTATVYVETGYPEHHPARYRVRNAGTLTPAKETPTPRQAAASRPPPFAAGHRVVFLPTGETWTVDSYSPPTSARDASLLLGRSPAVNGASRGEVMDASPGDVRLVIIPGRPPWPPFAGGDRVLDLLTGETWNVYAYHPAAAGRPARVSLFRQAPGDGTPQTATADARHLELLQSWTEREVFPCDGWSAELSAYLTAARHEPQGGARPEEPGPG